MPVSFCRSCHPDIAVSLPGNIVILCQYIPSCAYSTIADSQYGRRFRLAGGGLATVVSLQEELRTNLERVRLQYALTQVQEHVVAELIRGLEALP
jgi:hypothetical protein